MHRLSLIPVPAISINDEFVHADVHARARECVCVCVCVCARARARARFTYW